MANWGIRVSKDGYDVLTDADRNMAFTSKYVSEKVVQSAVITVAMTGTTGSTTYAHGLGYAPKLLAWDFENVSILLPHFIRNAFGISADQCTADIAIDSTNVTVTITMVSGTHTGNVRFTVFFLDKAI
jgi:hypothetical protein